MKTFWNPNFKLNGQHFGSAEILGDHALHLSKEGRDEEVAVGNFILECLDNKDFINVNTSGSTGNPKQIDLKKQQIINSAIATIKYFNLKEDTKALLCLSPEYIAGKMMLVRAMIAGWDLYTTVPGKNPLNNFPFAFDFAAMVPYQVFHSFGDLHKVKKLIIGGGPVSWHLEEKLQSVDAEIFATYGMTETISHIAVRPLNGKERSPIFEALPEVSFAHTDEGCLQIAAPNISDELVVTNDVVELLSPTSFMFLGRTDNVINSGGIKIHPELVEEKLSPYIKTPFFIASEENTALGEQVILILENEKSTEDFQPVFESLSSYEKPKKIYSTPQFAYTDTGKIKRGEVMRKLFGNQHGKDLAD